MTPNRILRVLLALGLLLGSSVSPALAQEEGPDREQNREAPESLSGLRLSSPQQLSGLSQGLLQQSVFSRDGSEEVIIRLASQSVAEYDDESDSGRQGQRDRILAEQDAFIARVQAVDPGARVIARVQVVLNAVFMEIDAAALPALLDDPAVIKVTPVANYEVVLGETVPYIGGTAVQSLGFDGSGVQVAVLDSGVDYLHASFGGSGDPAEFAANDPTIIEPGSFPTDKVVGGFDFVGGVWPNAPLAPDPDPLDEFGAFQGHGTHVADIIGGSNGVAPGVDLFAVKVCSSSSTSCSGIALIQGMEFAVDPNGDGNPSDHVDIINMSLGAPYGQPFDDDLSQAVENATDIGVLTVAASGNGGDKPYITDSPAAASSAISVAQTHVPSAFLQAMAVLEPAGAAGLYDAIFQSWSAPLTSTIGGLVQFGDGAGGNLNGCGPFAAGSLAGKIVAVDRGSCFFSDKIRNIENGGGALGIIMLVAPGDPFPGGFGGGPPIGIPGFMIRQTDGDILRAGDAVVSFDPAVGFAQVGSMVSSSSRGPSAQDNSIKPEIGAPGASVSAAAGTGTGVTPFGGTSGATPMISGSAALLLQARGEEFDDDLIADGDDDDERERHEFEDDGLSPLEIKALLMNTAETEIPNAIPGAELAPISRIGGGEVRVDQAVASPVAAWDKEAPTGGLSFGFVDVADTTMTLKATVRIRNYSEDELSYEITPTFRYANDQATGAVNFGVPGSVDLEEDEDTKVKVTLTIQGASLPGNFMNSGSQGANPAALTMNEFDGYLNFNGEDHEFHMPWQLLPRKAARVAPSATTIQGGGFPEVIGLDNTGVGIAQNDAYSLIATSPDIPKGGPGQQSPTPDIRAVGVNTFPVPAGFCSAEPSFIWAFAINTWERQTHLLPVSHQVWLDTDQDGTSDFVVLNRDLSFSGASDGRQVSWALDLAAGTASAFFFAEHATNTGNTVLYICGEQIGLSGPDILATNVDGYVIAQDFYFGGPGDSTEGFTITPLGERFFGMPNDVAGNTNDPNGLLVYDFGPFPGNSPELGVMLFTNGDRGTGARGGATQDTEALLFLVDGSAPDPTPTPTHDDDDDSDDAGDDNHDDAGGD